MKKAAKLKICNYALLFLTIAILISGIQLEATGCAGKTSVWLHIVIGILFMSIAAYHIFIHFGKSNPFAKFRKIKSQPTRILWWVSLITLATGLATLIHWLATHSHTPLGGIHGKAGLLMIALSAMHIIKRIKFFKPKK